MSALAITASLIALARFCAPDVAPGTLLTFAYAESTLDPLAVHSNVTGRAYHPATKPEAIATAARLVAVGERPDLGLMQVNTANLSWLGVSISEAFELCPSMRSGARILHTAFDPCVARGGEPQACLQIAASTYNTGSPSRGFANGYVRTILAQAERVIPEIRTVSVTPRMAGPSAVLASPCADDDWHASAACSKPSDLESEAEPPDPDDRLAQEMAPAGAPSLAATTETLAKEPQ